MYEEIENGFPKNFAEYCFCSWEIYVYFVIQTCVLENLGARTCLVRKGKLI